MVLAVRPPGPRNSVSQVFDWSLISGPVPVALVVAGAAALLYLLLADRRRRRWWSRSVPIVLLCSGVALAVAMIAFASVQVFPDPPPDVVWWAVAAVLVAIGLTIAGARRAGWVRRIVALVAVPVVLLAAGNEVNRSFGEFPTLGAAAGLPPANQVDLGPLLPGSATASGSSALAGRPGRPLSSVWRAPPGMPSAGVVAQIAIPPTASGFVARRGWVYLPAAYLAAGAPRLPVLVLLSGQPGGPRDWISAGGLSAMMDRFAAAHGGLAPVVVMPDQLGSTLANPMCLDSRLGRSATYLSVDVPAWIDANLKVDRDPSSRAIAGLSEGGTCALQMAVNSPRIYPTFVDISGQSEPTLGNRALTVAKAFNGDAAAFTAVDALDVMAKRRFPATAAMIVAGSDDPTYRGQSFQVAAACRRAGMQVEIREVRGGHNWGAWSLGLQTSLPWLGKRLHLTF